MCRVNAMSWPRGPRWASPGPACDNQVAVSSLRNAAGPRCPDPTAQQASGAPGPGLISSSSSGPGPGRGQMTAPHRWPSPGLLGCVCVFHVLFLGPGHLWTPAEASQSARSLRPRGCPDHEEDRAGQGRLGQRAPSIQGCSGASEWQPQACSRGHSVCSQRPGLGLIRVGVGAGLWWVTLAWSQP